MIHKPVACHLLKYVSLQHVVKESDSINHSIYHSNFQLYHQIAYPNGCNQTEQCQNGIMPLQISPGRLQKLSKPPQDGPRTASNASKTSPRSFKTTKISCRSDCSTVCTEFTPSIREFHDCQCPNRRLCSVPD